METDRQREIERHQQSLRDQLYKLDHEKMMMMMKSMAKVNMTLPATLCWSASGLWT